MARPSLRVLLAVASVTVFALAVPAVSQAEQPEPLILTKTNPVSSESQPAGSTTPFVQGRADGSIITSLPGDEVSGYSFSAADVNPSNVVALYDNPSCSGEPVETGNVGQLEGAGIQVEVAADLVTVFYATQTDMTSPSEPSECSKKGLAYWHSSTATPPGENPPGNPGGEGSSSSDDPPPAPRLRTVPGGRANDNTPKLTGSAPGASTVKVFAGAECKGAPVAQGSPGQFSAGFEVRVVDNMVAVFSAASFAGGKQSACSDPVAYVEDSTAPRTRITMGPGAKTRKRTAVFRFTDVTDNAPGTTFFCKLDRRKWKQCGSPYKVKKLPRKGHTIRVKAIDPAGNAEGKGAKRRFKVIP